MNSHPSELEAREIQSVTSLECLAWSSKLEYGATRFNALIGALKHLFSMAVTSGIIVSNPAECIDRIPVRIKPPKLPTHEQFLKILAYLESSPESRRACPFVKFLAYSGMRIGELQKLKREDITVHGIRIEDQKNGETSYVPIIGELAQLIKTLPSSGPLFKVKNPRRAIRNACLNAGVKPITNHQLRHLFATRCIECGMSIKVLASEFLRHRDGGALALKRYTHVRREHAEQQAALVTFGAQK